MKGFVLKDGKNIVFPHTAVMGILNINADSFYVGNRVPELEDALKRAEMMISDGAEILDIGGESTRPGSDPITVQEEQNRVIPVVKAIKAKYPDILISVDTYNVETAKSALEAGMDILNDITALSDDRMTKFVADSNIPVILMHMKGKPKDMQTNPVYDNVVEDVQAFFHERIEHAVAMGIRRDKLILDPGIGFGKNYDHNIALIKNINRLKEFELPILLAVSRKAFIGKTLGDLPATERMEGTMAISVYAAEKDIEMVRVHDVKENVRAIRMVEALK